MDLEYILHVILLIFMSQFDHDCIRKAMLVRKSLVFATCVFNFIFVIRVRDGGRVRFKLNSTLLLMDFTSFLQWSLSVNGE